MRSLAFVAAYAALAKGLPGRPPPEWHWTDHEHPGWPKPSIYTPHGPPMTWPHHPYPTSTAVSSPAPSASASASTSASASATASSASSIDACASVSELAKSATNADPSATPTVPASLAWECINEVPFKSDVAVELMDSMRPYIDWQTTIEYLKDPPAEYAEKIQPPYDFYGNYNSIQEKAASNGYSNEREFAWDLYRAFQMAHDGHFVYYPLATNLVFSFGRTTPLVSVSMDGESVPEVYVFQDVLDYVVGNASFTPSPLTGIDGQDSTEFLLDWSQYGSLQDRDALWNNMFYLLAQVSLGPTGTGTGTFSGGGRGQWVYPGASTTLTFANGSSVTNENYARVLVPFDGIQSGQDLRKTYWKIPKGQPEPVESIAASSSASSSAVASSSSSSAAASPTIPAPGYPSPIIREPNNLNSGYFLEGEGYDDVCVLSVPSFVGLPDDELDFQIVNTYTINECVAAGKTKLIIDVSANGGGTILQGYDLFKQLFPQILPYGASRFRAHESFDLIGQEVSWYSGQFVRELNANNYTVDNIIATPYNYRSDRDVNYQPFTSWSEKYGPHAYGPEPDNFTTLQRWYMQDPLTPINSGGIYISGYGPRANITQQPFKPEDIVIVYDGYCASTCTIFSELMRQQGGVKTIALGGRPDKDIIQAVGGVKGTNDFPYSYILYSAELPFKIAHYHTPDYYNTTALGAYNDLPLLLGVNWVVNSRDGIREGDTSETPLQFVYEPANCRIYYTPAMAVSQTETWQIVADTAFKGMSHCVAGSYDDSASKVKRSERARHRMRREVNAAEHMRAMSEVWTGKNGITMDGDGFMPL